MEARFKAKVPPGVIVTLDPQKAGVVDVLIGKSSQGVVAFPNSEGYEFELILRPIQHEETPYRGRYPAPGEPRK